MTLVKDNDSESQIAAKRFKAQISCQGQEYNDPGRGKAVAKAHQEIKEGKVRTFKNVDEYLKYLNTV
jgi:hypothetical protein